MTKPNAIDLSLRGEWWKKKEHTEARALLDACRIDGNPSDGMKGTAVEFGYEILSYVLSSALRQRDEGIAIGREVGLREAAEECNGLARARDVSVKESDLSADMKQILKVEAGAARFLAGRIEERTGEPAPVVASKGTT